MSGQSAMYTKSKKRRFKTTLDFTTIETFFAFFFLVTYLEYQGTKQKTTHSFLSRIFKITLRKIAKDDSNYMIFEFEFSTLQFFQLRFLVDKVLVETWKFLLTLE